MIDDCTRCRYYTSVYDMIDYKSSEEIELFLYLVAGQLALTVIFFDSEAPLEGAGDISFWKN